MKNETTSSSVLDFNLLSDYYKAMEFFSFGDFDKMDEFKKAHPKEFSRFNQVHQKRAKIRSNLMALKSLNKDLYFGTLTFDEKHDKNTETWKRKQAFQVLNRLFEFVLVVEELGEENGRYHIHFVGVFRDDKNFDDFIKSWHSRQNLEKVENIDKCTAYLVKYVSKALPRIRRNKALVMAEKGYKIGKHMCRIGFHDRDEHHQALKTLFLCAVDEL